MDFNRPTRSHQERTRAGGPPPQVLRRPGQPRPSPQQERRPSLPRSKGGQAADARIHAGALERRASDSRVRGGAGPAPAHYLRRASRRDRPLRERVAGTRSWRLALEFAQGEQRDPGHRHARSLSKAATPSGVGAGTGRCWNRTRLACESAGQVNLQRARRNRPGHRLGLGERVQLSAGAGELRGRRGSVCRREEPSSYEAGLRAHGSNHRFHRLLGHAVARALTTAPRLTGLGPAAPRILIHHGWRRKRRPGRCRTNPWGLRLFVSPRQSDDFGASLFTRGEPASSV